MRSSPRLDLLGRELPWPLSEWSGSGGQSRAVWLLGSPLLVEGLRWPVSRVSPAVALLQCRLSRGGAVLVALACQWPLSPDGRGTACRREQVRRFRERCRQRGQKAASEPRRGPSQGGGRRNFCRARPGVTYCFAAPGVAPVSSVAVPCAAELCVACGCGKHVGGVGGGCGALGADRRYPQRTDRCARYSRIQTARSTTSARQMPWSEYGFLKRSEKRPFPAASTDRTAVTERRPDDRLSLGNHHFISAR